MPLWSGVRGNKHDIQLKEDPISLPLASPKTRTYEDQYSNCSRIIRELPVKVVFDSYKRPCGCSE